jgi:hypothetical protein
VSGVQSRVCGSDVAGLEHEEITWNDPARRHHDAVAVSHHPRTWRCHRAERRYRTLSSVFLKKPDDRVDNHNRADRDRIEQFPDGYGQNGGGE